MRFAGLAIILVAVLATFSGAAAPTTRPKAVLPSTPPAPRERTAIIDPRQPAFVPKFAQVNNPPAGQFAERSYVQRFTVPAIYGYGYCAWGGYSSGSGYFGGGGNWSGFTAWQ